MIIAAARPPFSVCCKPQEIMVFGEFRATEETVLTFSLALAPDIGGGLSLRLKGGRPGAARSADNVLTFVKARLVGPNLESTWSRYTRTWTPVSRVGP